MNQKMCIMFSIIQYNNTESKEQQKIEFNTNKLPEPLGYEVLEKKLIEHFRIIEEIYASILTRIPFACDECNLVFKILSSELIYS